MIKFHKSLLCHSEYIMVLKYKVASDSMEPLIPVGAELLFEPVEQADIRRFDILVFQGSKSLMCHYVWHVNKVYNKGDITTRNLVNGEMDAPFEFDKVKGRVTNFKIGYFLKCRILLGWI